MDYHPPFVAQPPEEPQLNMLQKFWRYISSPRYSRTIGFIAILVIITAIPLTVYISQQNQDNRQRASSTTQTDTYLAQGSCTTPLTTLSVSASGPTIFQICVNTKATAGLAGYDITVNVSNNTSFGSITYADGPDASKFPNNAVSGPNVTGGNIHISRLLIGSPITGTLNLGTITLGPATTGSSGTISMSNPQLVTLGSASLLTTDTPSIPFTVSPAAAPGKLECVPVGGMGNRFNSDSIVVTNNKSVATTFRVQQNLCNYAGQGAPVPAGVVCDQFVSRTDETLAPGASRTFSMTVPNCKIGQVDVYEGNPPGFMPEPNGCYTDANAWWSGGLGFAIKANPTGWTGTSCPAAPTNTPTPTPTGSGPGPVSTAPTASISGPSTATTGQSVSYQASVTSSTGIQSSNVYIAKDGGTTPIAVTNADISNYNVANFNCATTNSDGTQAPSCSWYRIGSGTTATYTGTGTLLTAGTYKVSMDAEPIASNSQLFLCSGNPYVTSWPLPPLSSTTATQRFYDCGANSRITLTVGSSITLAPTLAPTLTPTPTPTVTQGGTQFAIILKLGAIGAPTENLTPVTTTRIASLQVLSSSDQPVGSIATGNITYQAPQGSTPGVYTGTISTGQNLPTGSYSIKVKTDRNLWKKVAGFYNATLSSTVAIQLPRTNLATGDANNDGIVNIADYNVLYSCFEGKATTSSCANRVAPDFDDNGVVDGVDFNVMVRSLGNQSGD